MTRTHHHTRPALAAACTLAVAFTLAAAMLLPARAWAATGIDVGGDFYGSAFTLDGISWDGADTITLTDYYGSYLAIDGTATLVLEGENTLTNEVTNDANAFAIHVQGDPASLTITGDGSLTISNHAQSNAYEWLAAGIKMDGAPLLIADTTVSIEVVVESSGGTSSDIWSGPSGIDLYGEDESAGLTVQGSVLSVSVANSETDTQSADAWGITASGSAGVEICEGSEVTLQASAVSDEPNGACANCIKIDGDGQLTVTDSTLNASAYCTGNTISTDDQGHPYPIAVSMAIGTHGNGLVTFASSRITLSGSLSGMEAYGSVTIDNCDLHSKGAVSTSKGTITITNCEGDQAAPFDEDDSVNEIVGTMMPGSGGEATLQHTGPASAYVAGVQDGSAPEASTEDAAMADNAEQLPIVIGLAGGFFGLILVAGIIVKSRRKRADT